jgi:hypothetical protein
LVEYWSCHGNQVVFVKFVGGNVVRIAPLCIFLSFDFDGWTSTKTSTFQGIKTTTEIASGFVRN